MAGTRPAMTASAGPSTGIAIRAKKMLAKIRRQCYALLIDRIGPLRGVGAMTKRVENARETFCAQPETGVDFLLFLSPVTH